MINKPSRASPNDIRITASVAKPNRGRLELGVGPVDGFETGETRVEELST